MVRVRRQLVLGGLLLLASCLSPTLPLPPPAEPEAAAAGQGLVELSGEVPEPRVPVVAENQRTGLFAGATSDDAGSYRFQIGAEAGDPMRLWYVVGNDRSEEVLFSVPDLALMVPELPTITLDDATGAATLSGVIPSPVGEVFVRHLGRDELTSVVADADGAYTIELLAVSGDQLELWYALGLDASSHVTFAVP